MKTILSISKIQFDDSRYDIEVDKVHNYFADGLIVHNCKEDGGRLIAETDFSGEVSYRSRNGNKLNLFGVFDKQLCKYVGMVFDGELVVIQKDGKLGNGVNTLNNLDSINSTIKQKKDVLCVLEQELKNLKNQL